MTPTRSRLDAYLTALLDAPEAYGDTARAIDEAFGEECAVLVLDMSGFTRVTEAHGILACLLLIAQMQAIVLPALREAGGQVVKADADDIFAVFPTVDQAVAASLASHGQLEIANRILPSSRRLHVSIGIGFGRVLNVDGQDIFGDQVNQASRLGEDIGDSGETLLTDAARAQASADVLTRAGEAVRGDRRVPYHQLLAFTPPSKGSVPS